VFALEHNYKYEEIKLEMIEAFIAGEVENTHESITEFLLSKVSS
jgi:hypothetical protein